MDGFTIDKDYMYYGNGATTAFLTQLRVSSNLASERHALEEEAAAVVGIADSPLLPCVNANVNKGLVTAEVVFCVNTLIYSSI